MAKKKAKKKVAKKKTTKRKARSKSKRQAPDEQQAPDEAVTRISREDSLHFGKLDAEIRNAAQGIQLLNYRIAEEEAKYKARQLGLTAERGNLEMTIKTIKPEYEALVAKLAKESGIENPKTMAVDPDTGTVRDLSKH